jgi:hypothetical protein
MAGAAGSAEPIQSPENRLAPMVSVRLAATGWIGCNPDFCALLCSQPYVNLIECQPSRYSKCLPAERGGLLAIGITNARRAHQAWRSDYEKEAEE